MTSLWNFWLLTLLDVVLHLEDVHSVKPREGMSYEDEVVKYVLENYKKRTTYGRPVKKYNDTLTVSFAIQLQQIMGLSEQNQVLTLNIWDQLSWMDANINWNMSEYGGVVSVRLPCNKIWTPDIKLTNYADTRLTEHRDALCIVDSTGLVYHVPQVVYQSSCPIDVYVFPFDVQNCSLRFISWTYGISLMDLVFLENKEWIDLSEYIESSSWTILDVPAIRNVTKYTCCPELDWVDLHYFIIFQRRSALYNYILVLPCILLTSITLILFFIPPESPAKMQLGLAVFTAFFVLLRLLEKNLPPGTIYMPLLGTYYCLNMLLITLSSFLNVLIVDLTTHGTRASALPKLRYFFFNHLAKCLFMEDLVRPFKGAVSKTRTPRDGESGKLEDKKWTQESDASPEGVVSVQPEQMHQIANEDIGIFGDINIKLEELREFMRFQKLRLKERDEKESIAKQWKAVALLLDRVFFIVYLVVIVGSVCYTLPVLTATEQKANYTRLSLARGPQS
ncbi:hypothetical protein BsWGS_20307 [Bradybaena similaris]